MNFHKSQKFTLLGRISTLSDRHNHATGHDRVYPIGATLRHPSWVEYDMRVLCFDGYFHENLAEMQQSGSYRIRNVKIAFYLEDETVQIVEPKVHNSGIPQGCIVKRQRVTERTSNPENKRFITLMDLNVNQSVTIFDRVYHITSCDAATRTFLSKLGITVPQSTTNPPDPNREQRQLAEEVIRGGKKKMPKNNKFAQFLQNSRKVLQFTGYWDDRASLFGDIHHLILHYYLADDTIEIKEALPVNSGRHESSGIFLKRMRLPKRPTGLSDIGQTTAAFAVLNVMGENFNTGRFVRDSVDSLEKQEFYNFMDLSIGAEVNVFGRRLVLASCDGFTKNFLMEHFGIEEFPQIAIPQAAVGEQTTTMTGVGKLKAISDKLNHHSKAEVQLPPFNGWGTHEDSEGNCKTVEPKPPPIDYDKFVKLDGKMLRFAAKMAAKNAENSRRTFIIIYYLSNDTIAVYECPERNSGFSGGQFLHRQKIYLPDQDFLAAQRPKAYTAQHFYVGATINLNSHIFRVIGADQFALDYMERNRQQFPFSDIIAILEKCRNQFRDHIDYKNLMAKYWATSKDEEKGGQNHVSAEVIRRLLCELFANKGAISEQEIITVCRHFSVAHQRRLHGTQVVQENRAVLRNIIQDELQRSLWSDYEKLGHYLKYIESHGQVNAAPGEYISPSKLLTVVRGVKLPLNSDQIELMLDVLEKNEQGDVNIADFINFLQRPATDREESAYSGSSFGIIQGNKSSGSCQSENIDWNKFVDSIAV